MTLREHLPPTEKFVETFQDTIIASSIPNSEFIDWDGIEVEIDDYEEQIEAISKLAGVSEEAFIEGVADALMAADDTRKWINFYFELLGERGNKYSSLEGLWKFYDVQRAIDNGSRDKALDLAAVLQDVGLQYVVNHGSVRDHYRGMLVGMESHARKNRQGSCFEDVVGNLVDDTVMQLWDEGYDASWDDEYITEYDDDSGQNKTVDFAIFDGDGDLRVAIEANCYKVGGSKPSEIRRSYNHVAQRMRKDGIEFAWITDGQGYEKSLVNVLRQSYEDIRDIYNLHQAEKHLANDILNEFEP